MKSKIIGAVVVAVLLAFVYKLVTKPNEPVNNVAELIKLEQQSPVVTKDKAGRTHVQKQLIYVSDKQAALLYRRELDSLTAILKVKDKQIVSLTNLVGKATVVFVPTIKDSVITYESKWVSLYGSTYQGRPFTLSFRDSVNLVFIKRRYGLLNLKERIEVNAYSANKDMVYYNIKSWAVPQATNNRSWLGFGVTAGYGFQMSNNAITYGPQITGGLQIRF